MSHTPGPWVANEYGVVHAPAGKDEHNQQLWRDIYFDRDAKTNEERVATARLIAAAPDLLAALRCALADLEGALQAHRDGDPHAHDWKAHALSIDEARAAIAKAEGQQ